MEILVALPGGTGADDAVGTRFPEINIIPGTLLVSGLACSASEVLRAGRQRVRGLKKERAQSRIR